MKLLLNILAFTLCIGGAVVGVLFYLDNLTPIAVNFLGKPIAELQLALWLLGFFTAGCLVGWLIASTQAVKYRYQLRCANKSKEKSQELVIGRAPLANS